MINCKSYEIPIKLGKKLDIDEEEIKVDIK